MQSKAHQAWGAFWRRAFVRWATATGLSQSELARRTRKAQEDGHGLAVTDSQLTQYAGGAAIPEDARAEALSWVMHKALTEPADFLKTAATKYRTEQQRERHEQKTAREAITITVYDREPRPGDRALVACPTMGRRVEVVYEEHDGRVVPLCPTPEACGHRHCPRSVIVLGVLDAQPVD